MNRIITITLLVQAVGVIVLLSMWIVKRADDDPAAPFRVLVQVIEAHGPVRALDYLGPDIIKAADLSCRRDACIARRFGGNRGRWVVSAAAKGTDPCETFRHPPCKRGRIRQALVGVMQRAAACEVRGVLNRGADKRIRVQCGGTQDFVTVSRDAAGRWRLAGDEDYPGFLPRLFDGAKP